MKIICADVHNTHTKLHHYCFYQEQQYIYECIAGQNCIKTISAELVRLICILLLLISLTL